MYGENPDGTLPVDQTKAPYFVLWVGPMNLPWVLDEPLEEEEIVSPANQPSFLKRMWNWLLNRSPVSDLPN